MGVANPRAAAERTVAVARELGLTGLKVAAVEGDDVTHLMQPDTPLWEGTTRGRCTGRSLVGRQRLPRRRRAATRTGGRCQVVITGRVADPSMFLARCCATASAGTMTTGPARRPAPWSGHLLECAGQITGGYFADPGSKDVPGLARLGFPYRRRG